MQAIENGVMSLGDVCITLGGGWSFELVSQLVYNEKLRAHTFCCAPRDT